MFISLISVLRKCRFIKIDTYFPIKIHREYYEQFDFRDPHVKYLSINLNQLYYKSILKVIKK